MNIGCWYIQGIRSKYHEIFKALDERKVDIAVFSETKKKGNGNERKENYLHFYSVVEKVKRARAGVDLEYLCHKIVIVGVYGPTVDAPGDVKYEFFENLITLLKYIGINKEILMMGDFNGWVGKKVQNNMVGSHGKNIINDNGLILIEACEQQNLTILNGFFEHKDIHKYTWMRPTNQQSSIIDYVLVRQTSTVMVYDVRVQRGALCSLDYTSFCFFENGWKENLKTPYAKQ